VRVVWERMGKTLRHGLFSCPRMPWQLSASCWTGKFPSSEAAPLSYSDSSRMCHVIVLDLADSPLGESDERLWTLLNSIPNGPYSN
jgi:hypothetical protein